MDVLVSIKVRPVLVPVIIDPQKGKQGTKGQKQIIDENNETLQFYRNMVFGANVIYLTVMSVFFDLFSFFYIALFVITSCAYIGSYQFMVYMARPKYGEDGHVVDSGCDLNISGGIAEHVKDMIILTAGSQLTSLFSNYFWLLMLLAPGRGFHLLWANILSPYIFQQAPPQEVDEKKQKKHERKMARRQQH